MMRLRAGMGAPGHVPVGGRFCGGRGRECDGKGGGGDETSGRLHTEQAEGNGGVGHRGNPVASTG